MQRLMVQATGISAGSIESTGLFHINERWKWGWDGALLSDRWFLDNYKIRNQSIQTLYYRDVISTLYLRGQGDRSFFDARGYYFMPTTSSDWQKQQPVVAPVIDYNKRWNGPQPLGGEVAVDVNLTSLTREQTQYGYLYRPGATNLDGTPVNPLVPPSLFNSRYEGCVQYAPVKYVNGRYASGDCLIRGLAGAQNRISTSLTWRRQFIDALGQVWTPFAGVRLDGIWNSPNLSSGPNTFARNLGVTDPQDNFFGRAMPAIGLEYRFPLVANTSWGTHIIEPIAQIVARPNEARSGNLPNNDALSLTFDDTNIFDWNKFSGYDRVEGGVRANIGAQYTFHMNGGGYANVLVGQSYQLAGRNSVRAVGISPIQAHNRGLTGAHPILWRVLFTRRAPMSLSLRAAGSTRTSSRPTGLRLDQHLMWTVSAVRCSMRAMPRSRIWGIISAVRASLSRRA